jgi:hypothetical protein
MNPGECNKAVYGLADYLIEYGYWCHATACHGGVETPFYFKEIEDEQILFCS